MSIDNNKDKEVHYTFDFGDKSVSFTDAGDLGEGKSKKKEHTIINHKKINKKFILPTVIIAVVVAIVVIIIVGTSDNVLRNKTIKFNRDCFEVYISGYENFAEVRVTPNYEEIKSVVMKVLNKKKEIDDDSHDAMFGMFYEALNITVDTDGRLQNGDVVTITIDVREKILEELDVKIDNTEFSVEITELDTALEVNPFEYMNIYAKNTVGDSIQVPIHFTYPEEFYGLTSSDFSVSYSEYFQSGDVFTIAIDEYVVNKLLRQGIILTQTEFSFTMEDVDGELVSDFETIADSILASLELRASADIERLYEEETEVSLNELEYYGGWFNVYSNSSQGNELALIFEASVSHNTALFEPVTTYIKVTFSEIVVEDDVVTVMGYYSNIDATPLYFQGKDVVHHMGFGRETYEEYLMEMSLSSSVLYTQFDQEGNITEY